MPREIITVNIGGCGVRFGSTVWQQYFAEHKIDEYGKRHRDEMSDPSLGTFFNETKDGSYIPRNLFIDTDPNEINNLKENSKYNGLLFHDDYQHVAGSANKSLTTWANGHYKIGAEYMDECSNRMIKLVEDCDNIDGIIVNHAVSGGTGSGLTCRFLERISVDYRKKQKMAFHVYPTTENQGYQSMLQYLNGMITTYYLLDHTEYSVIFDNNKLNQMCNNFLNLHHPSYKDMNLLLAKIESSMTMIPRFHSYWYSAKYSLWEDLVCFPRLHFLTTSIAPILTDKSIKKLRISPRTKKSLVDGFLRNYYPFYDQHQNINNSIQLPLYQDIVQLIYFAYIQNGEFESETETATESGYYDIDDIMDLSFMCFDPEYMMIECDDFDHMEDKFMSLQMAYCGDVEWKQVRTRKIREKLKEENRTTFIEWAPTGFKMDVRDVPGLPTVTEDDTMIATAKNASIVGNNTCISRFFEQRYNSKFDKVFKEKKYWDLYFKHGMEEGEFKDAREEMEFLARDYMDVLSEQATDSEDESD